jgi:P63C domain
MQIANSKQFPPLETVTRPTVETAAAAFYFNRREKTLRGWACHEDGPSGYQRFRAKDSLAKILEPYVAKELQPYVSLFPPEFYQEIFRLRGLSFPTGAVKRPQYFGHITNDIIYRRLAPGVWKELKAKVQKDEKGRAKHKLFQHLTSKVRSCEATI